MDEDDFEILFVFLFFAALFGIILFFILLVTCTVAYHRTREWQTQKARALQGTDATTVESQNLINERDDAFDPDSDLDPDDPDDAAELQAREDEKKEREEFRRDLGLTTAQKFRKEFKRAWKGKGSIQAEVLKKEREDRRKLARAVAKEVMRMERRKQRKANRQTAEETDSIELPTYNKATKEMQS